MQSCFFIRKIKQHDCVCQIKHKTRAQNPCTKTKACLKNVSKKSHPFTKGSVGACMQIVNLLTVQHHITAKDKNLYMCYKNITLGEQNSIASSNSSKLSVSTFFWFWVLQQNAFSKPTLLFFRRSLVFHCSYIKNWQCWERCYQKLSVD